MKMGKKTLIALILASWFLVGTLGYSVRSGYIFGHRDPSPSANVYILFELAKGTYGQRLSLSGNIITNIGERYVRNIMGWDNQTSNNATQWIALGNSTISASNTKLDTEATGSGFVRSANDTCLAWMNGTDYAYNVTNRFTATGTIRVNASSIHWNPTSNSDNNAYAMASISATTFENNDNCTIVWVLTWDCN